MSSQYAQYVPIEENRRESTSSTKSVKNAMKWVAQKYKEHDASVQAAWEVYYGAPATGFSSQAASRKSSADSNASTSSKPFKKAWTAVKERASEHHQNVNAAFSTYYGDARVHQQRAEAIKQFDKSY